MSSAPVVLKKTIDLPKSGCSAVVLSINRPSQLNCFNLEVCALLSKHINEIIIEQEKKAFLKNNDNNDDDDDDSENDIVAVILTGEGKSFCAGADLSNPPNPIDQASDLPDALQNNPVYQMGRLQIPIIGALKGWVITGGFELALACDILVGTPDTKFKDTHVKFGLAPCWGLSQKLQRRVGSGRAKIISLTANTIKSNLALEWGLLDEVCDSGDKASPSSSSLKRSIDIADDIGMNNKVMVQRYKRAIDEGGSMDLHHGLQRERALGLAHYIEKMAETMESAQSFKKDNERKKSSQHRRSKL